MPLSKLGEKKISGNEFVAMALSKYDENFFLLQLVCGNAIAEIEERYKKKYAYS